MDLERVFLGEEMMSVENWGILGWGCGAKIYVGKDYLVLNTRLNSVGIWIGNIVNGIIWGFGLWFGDLELGCGKGCGQVGKW